MARSFYLCSLRILLKMGQRKFLSSGKWEVYLKGLIEPLKGGSARRSFACTPKCTVGAHEDPIVLLKGLPRLRSGIVKGIPIFVVPP